MKIVYLDLANAGQSQVLSSYRILGLPFGFARGILPTRSFKVIASKVHLYWHGSRYVGRVSFDRAEEEK